MGISRSRVSHRISARTLYAFTLQGRRYVPRWQFVAAPKGEPGVVPVPGLAQIVPMVYERHGQVERAGQNDDQPDIEREIARLGTGIAPTGTKFE